VAIEVIDRNQGEEQEYRYGASMYRDTINATLWDGASVRCFWSVALWLD